MGRVISIDRWLEQRGRPHVEDGGGEVDAVRDDGVARLERAVARLEPLLARGAPATRTDLETELLAVSGAVSLGLYVEAARRAERLADRLTARRREEG
jgi:hypothetical protein